MYKRGVAFVKFFLGQFYSKYSYLLTYFKFKVNHVRFKKFRTFGLPLLEIAENSIFQLGNDFVMVNSAKYSTLGKNNRCKFVVYKEASLLIGDHVGMSNATIAATSSIIIGNNVMIGGGVTIIDSDFHSLNPSHWHTNLDEINMKSRAVKIGDNVFIGMNAIILKGVTIGSNSIVSAGSVVFEDIPDFQIWGGNPAKFIKPRII